jgi:hypothetical protein
MSQRVFPSQWLEDGRVPMPDVDQAIWNRLNPDIRARIAEKLPGALRLNERE